MYHFLYPMSLRSKERPGGKFYRGRGTGAGGKIRITGAGDGAGAGDLLKFILKMSKNMKFFEIIFLDFFFNF